MSLEFSVCQIFDGIFRGFCLYDHIKSKQNSCNFFSDLFLFNLSICGYQNHVNRSIESEHLLSCSWFASIDPLGPFNVNLVCLYLLKTIVYE